MYHSRTQLIHFELVWSRVQCLYSVSCYQDKTSIKGRHRYRDDVLRVRNGKEECYITAVDQGRYERAAVHTAVSCRWKFD